MDKLAHKYQEYRTQAALEDSPTNQAAQGVLEQMKSAARSVGILGPETPSVMSPTGDLGKMPAPPAEAPVVDTIRASTPQEKQRAKAAPTAQEAYDPSQAGLVGSSVEAGKSQGAQAVAGTYSGLADFYGTLDNLSGIVARKAGMGKPQVFEQLKGASEYWAQHYQGKVSIDDYMTKVVGGVLGSGPALVEFSMGPAWAALKGFSENGEIGDALYSAARRTAAGAVFKSAHTLDAPARIAAGTAYMTGESAAEQLGQTGRIDAGQTAEAAGVGLGMMLTGGLGAGNKSGMRQKQSERSWVETSAQGDALFKEFDAGRIDKMTKDLAMDFYAADPKALGDTTIAVVDKVNLIRKGVDDWILREQGIDPATQNDGKQYKITGKTSSRKIGPDDYRTAIELYQGHDAQTLAEEWFHREYDRLPQKERAAVADTYSYYRGNLPAEAQPMSEAEFYAKSATSKLFSEHMGRELSPDKPAWFDTLKSTRKKFLGLLDTIRGVPGAQLDEAGAKAVKQWDVRNSFQAAYHGSPYRFDKFTLDHIGKGEGAQAYGWGLYFAGNKEVAEYYRKELSAVKYGSHVVELAKDYLRERHGVDPNEEWGYSNEQDYIRLARQQGFEFEGDKNKGQLYEVTIPDADTMLDWDKPLSEQPKSVRKALVENLPNVMEKFYAEKNWPSDTTPREQAEAMVRGSGQLGRNIYHDLTAALGSDKAASEYLKSVGIPGLRYLDGTSRSKGEGHHNYVVFDDAQIAIDKTYYQVRPIDEIIYDPTPAPPLDQKYAEGGNLNLQKIGSTEDVLKLINDVSRHNRETGAFEQATRGVKTWAETTAAAEGEVRLDQMLLRKPGESGNAEQLLAARQLQAEFAAQTADLIARAKTTGDVADKDAAAKAWGVFSAITAARDGMAAEAGRALNIMARPVGDTRSQLISTAFADLARKHGGDRNADAIMDTLYDMAKLNADGKLDIEELARFARKVEPASTFDMILEARYMAMLANPATHVKNTLGNSIALGSQVIERGIAEGIGAVRAKFSSKDIDRVEAGETLAMMYGGIEGMRAGAKAFMQAVRTGESTDPLGKIETPRRAITAENLGVDKDSVWGKTIDFTAERLRTGTMALGAEDDFFKAVGYTMELNARAHRAASREGLTGQEFASRVQELVSNPPWDMQMTATDFAHYATFTNALGEGLTKVQGALGTDYTVTLPSGKTIEIPTGKTFRLAVPFFRTPANIVAYGVKRSPLAIFAPSVWQDFVNGGAARDLALARIGLGSAVGYMAAQAASAGLITGNGPSDQKEKENLREVGWQPYSVKVGDKWISYQGFEPFSAIVGAAADIALFDGYLEENERNNAAMMIAGAVSEAITSKTFIQGLDGLFNVMSDPNRYGDRYAQQFMASWVPSPVKAIRRDVDPIVREIWTVADALQNSLPWYSKDLYPRRNRYGEPITVADVWLSHTLDPARKSPIKNEENSPTYTIDKAIQENHVPIQKPGKVLHWEGVKVELTPEEFDRYQVLPRDLGLVDALDRVVRSPEFERATGGPDGIKSHMIREVFGDFRERARYELVRESQGIPGGVAERVELERLDRQMKGEAAQ